jgi:hypothetical protein
MHADNSEVLASISSGALKQTLHDVNELQKQGNICMSPEIFAHD